MADHAQLIDWIRLSCTENVGPVTFRYLLKRYGSASRALNALPEIAKRNGKDLNIPDIKFAQDQINMAEQTKAEILILEDAEYPTYLKAIEAAPPVLYLKGRKELLFGQCLAIVGSRNASLNGMNFTKGLSVELGKAGINIVSGLALGIDTAAHEGALTYGTIAVLGGGLDVSYPKENTKLQVAIGEEGLLISEFPFKTPPIASHFPRRNRIIAGLSIGVAVVEARAQSGSMITAAYANEFGRDVFAVPGFPYDPRSHGPNNLIRDGAILTRDARDILSNLPSHINTVNALDPKDYFPNPGPEVKGLAEMKAKIMDLISTSPVDVDLIIRHTQLSSIYVWDVILELELSGKLERHSGNKVSLKV